MIHAGNALDPCDSVVDSLTECEKALAGHFAAMCASFCDVRRACAISDDSARCAAMSAMPFEIVEVGERTALDRIDLSRVAAESVRVQMTRVPSPSRLADVAAWMQSSGVAQLRVYDDGTSDHPDLEFLEHFPFLTGFWVDLKSSLRSTAGLRFLGPSLTRLGLGGFHRPHPTGFVSQLPALGTLSLTGRADRPERLRELVHLEDLWLNGSAVTALPEMGVLDSVAALHLHGGSLRDLDSLHDLPNMQHLEIWGIRGLSDFDALGSLPALQVLQLDSLLRFERFPDLSGSAALRRVHTGTLKALVDLSALPSAVNLEELVLGLCPLLDPSELAVLGLCPRLQRVGAGLNSTRRDTAAAAFLARFAAPAFPSPWANWEEW